MTARPHPSDPEPLPCRAVRDLPWMDPLSVAAGLSRRDGALCLLSDGGPHGRWSYVAAEPDAIHVGPVADAAPFALLRDPAFQAQVVGLMSYDAGARAATGPRPEIWPDLMLARYPAMLVFDHFDRTVQARGLGSNIDAADAALMRAASWLQSAASPTTPHPPSRTFTPETSPASYCAAVSDVVARIAAGELFQANIARAWSGVLDHAADPFDVFVRLAHSRPAAYGAFWRLGDRALVSNSPELFVAFDPRSRTVETRPIKGTRGRGSDPAADAAQAADLMASAKDRAENLMIVDLMRNDLSRVCVPGSIRADRLFEIKSYPTVHHLVSTVTGRTIQRIDPADVLEATFPPGSITGAPKHQAMKVIADYEGSRGPWCGSLLLVDSDGVLTASVLIRTACFERGADAPWVWRALAGAGIVADSDPDAELAETGVKISALSTALSV